MVEVQPKQPTWKGPAGWFTGDVFIDGLAAAQGTESVTLGSVHFTPCAHTAWHRHSQGQTLCVTEGEGYVRWCFAAELDKLADGVARLKRALH